MSYAIAGGERYNMVLTHPRHLDQSRELTSLEILVEMKATYSTWDPRLVTVFYAS
jgi:hypothetical protein